MAAVLRWSGREAQALRQARRMSVRAFAEHLGVAPASVTNWERRGELARLRTETQQLLDIDLGRVSADVRQRFDATVAAGERRPERGERDAVIHGASGSAEAETTAAEPAIVGFPDRSRIPTRQPHDSDHGPNSTGWTSLSGDRLRVPSDGDDPVKRRTFMAVGGLAAAAATHVVQALSVTASDDVDDLGLDADGLGEVVAHYAQMANTAAPSSIYSDLLNVRTYAGHRLKDSGRSARRRSDLLVATGYLSSLLAIVTSYMNDHAAALVWCADAERRSRETGHHELAGWAFLTRATIAYYQGQAKRSVALSSQGQQMCRIGTVAHAKLAAQEMRACAMLGDSNGMQGAKRRASTAIEALPDGVPNFGVFSITPDEDPPYTATSLLLVGKFEQAVTATNRVIERTYRPGTHETGKQPSNYARSLLILGLAKAGIGNVAEASMAGKEALTGTRPVWPTLVLAHKLDQVMMRRFAATPEASDFRDCLMECVKESAFPHSQPRNQG